MTAHESREIRLKRLRMRSWRRGMKEMDLILGHFADEQLDTLDEVTLDRYESLLSENDQDLYRWVTARLPGRSADDGAPMHLHPLLEEIATHAAARLGTDS